MKPAKPRLPEFDIARGVAMLAIIFCHTCMLDYVTDGSQVAIEFCFTFNVALFFIVSGYFTKGTKVTKASLKKDAVSLLLPYAAASASLIVLATVFYLIVGSGALDSFIEWSVAALYGSGAHSAGMPSGVGAVGAIWFLLTLFWSKQLLISIMGMKNPGVWAVLLFLAGMNYGTSFWLPFSLHASLCGVLFMYVGRIAREEGLLKPGSIPIPLVLAIAGIGIYAGLFGGGSYMVENLYPSGYLNVAGGVCLSFLIIKLSREAAVRAAGLVAPLKWVGRRTLPILCMHLLFTMAQGALGSVLIPLTQGLSVVWPFAFALNVAGPVFLVGLLGLLPRPVGRLFGLSTD